jgi:hypothetical protein
MRTRIAAIAVLLILPEVCLAATRVNVPTDSRASYRILRTGKLKNGNIEVVSQRNGPSGVSYSKREVNCRNMTFRYTAEGDTLQELNDPYQKGAMAPLTEGSISTYISRAACRGR